MKKLILIHLLTLTFIPFLNAQFLGQEVYCEPVGQTDSFNLKLYRYHDASTLAIDDTVIIYTNTVANSPITQFKLGRKNKTLLYDSVYYVVYEARVEIVLFSAGLSSQNSILYDQYLDATNFDNYNDSTVYVNYGAGWYSSGSPAYEYITPTFNHSQFSFYQSGGYIKHDASVTTQSGNQMNYVLVSIDSFHTYPSGVTIDNTTGVMSIDTSLSGNYFIYIIADNAEQSIFRTMIIDVEKIKLQLATNTTSVIRKEEDFIVFPNPSTNVLSVKSETFIQELKIINMLGQVVKQQGVNNYEATLMIDDLPKGQYILRIRIGEDWYSKIFQKID